MALRKAPEKPWTYDPSTKEKPSYPWYKVNVEKYKILDIYRILELFQVTDAPIQHAIKKLLVAGKRTGGKDKRQDISEARDALTRMLEMMNEA